MGYITSFELEIEPPEIADEALRREIAKGYSTVGELCICAVSPAVNP